MVSNISKITYCFILTSIIACTSLSKKKDKPVSSKEFLIEQFAKYQYDNPQLAKKYLDTLIWSYRVSPNYYNQRGWLNLELEKYDSSIADFNYVIDKLDSNYLVNRANVYERTGRIDLALKDLKDYLSYRKDSGSFFMHVGMTYYNIKEYEKSKEYFVKGERFSTYKLPSIAMQARIKAALNDTLGACKDFKLILQIDSNYLKNISEDLKKLKCDMNGSVQ